MRLVAWALLGVVGGSTAFGLAQLAWDELQWRRIERRAGRRGRRRAAL